MIHAATALASLRDDDDFDELVLVVALKELERLCAAGSTVIITAVAGLSIFRKGEELRWVNTVARERTLTRRLGFYSRAGRGPGVSSARGVTIWSLNRRLLMCSCNY